jgi:hypothetical protein
MFSGIEEFSISGVSSLSKTACCQDFLGKSLAIFQKIQVSRAAQINKRERG